MIFRVFRAMRTILLGSLILGIVAFAFGVFSTPVNAVEGINERINFQGRLLTKEGATVPDGFYNVEFKIYQDGDGQTAGNTTGSPAGTLEWTEAWLNNDGNGVKVRNGYFSVELGSVTAFGSSVDWNQDTLYLSINVGDTVTTCTPFSSCNGDGEMLPMKRLSATPYALNAGKLGGRTADGFIQNNAGTPQAANISIQSADAGDVAAVIQGAASQTADIFQVKADSVATPLLAVSNAGSITITPTSDASPALTVNSTSGTIFSASATQISLNEDTVLASGKTLTVAGDTAFQKGTDFTTTGQSDDVDFGSGTFFRLAGVTAQTITGIANGVDGRTITLVNAGTNSATIANNSASSSAANRIITGTGNDITLTVGSGINLIYDSGASLWRVVGSAGGIAITLQDAYDNSATTNPQIQLDATNGGLKIQDASSTVGNILQIQDATGSSTYFAVTDTSVNVNALDATESGALEIGLASGGNATSINLNQDTTLAAGKTLTITGDTYTNIDAIGTPTEGMTTYDTTNKQLLTYANGKWKADSTDAILVAASNSSQADKNAADYVADGDTVAAADGDQVQINAALTAAAGKKVVLLAGTYTADASISVPNNTTLAGVGSGTLIQLADIDVDDNLIENTDQTTGTGIVIKDLRLDGQDTANTAGTQRGIYLNNMGSSAVSPARQGAIISGVIANDFRSGSIRIMNSYGNKLTNNSAEGSWEGFYIKAQSTTLVDNIARANTYTGYYLESAHNSTFKGNTAENNGASGFTFYTTSFATISGNVSSGNTSGFYLDYSSNNTASGNTASGNTTAGVYLNGSTNSNIVGNNLSDNGGATANNAIYIESADGNTVTGNDITDTSASTTNYAINISNVGSDKNYLADNRFSSTPGTSTIRDLGTGTVYANQSRAENGGSITTRTANSTTAFQIQDASGSNAFTVDTNNDRVIATTFEATSGFAVNGTDGATTTCNAGEYLDGAVVQGGIVTGGTCTTAAAGGNFVTLQATTPGTADVGNFYIDGTGIADILQATSHVYTEDIDTATAATLNIGAANATSVVIGKTDGSAGIALSANAITLGNGTDDTTVIAAAQTATDTNGNQLIIQGSTGNGTGEGGVVTVQGGTGGATGANGGNLNLLGGVATGSGATGLVVFNTPTFQTAINDANCFTGGSLVSSSCTISLTSVNGSAAILVGFDTGAQTATLPDPTITTAGRIIYVTAANGSDDFTLVVNGGGTGNQIAMRQNTTATMIWNGSDWTAAGASSSTTLQSAYDNTLQSAGGAELVVSSSGNTNGLTIRDSSTSPVNGRILTVQTSSAADLISVNSNVTEYASDAGAEVAGATDTTFPANTWSAISGATVSRHITAGDYIATGQGSVAVTTDTSAGSGVKNQLTTTLTARTTYNVSFAVRLDSSSSPFTDLEAYYSADGSAASVSCMDSKVVPTSVWTKVNCTFTAPSSGISSSNAIFIRQTGSGTAHTMYVDNLSVTIAADYNYASDGSVSDNTNFSTNWTSVGGATVTRDTLTGYDASDSAETITTGAGQGVRNKLSINPLESTLYRITVYAALDSGTFDNFTIRYSRDGGSNFQPCADYNTQTIATGSTYTKVTCYVETDATAATNPYVYFTQTDGTARTFHVDTFSMSLSTITTPNVQIGGGTNGGPTTLFTLDRGASAPIASDNDALLGSMYYDTTLGKLQCYEADGWGACGSSPDNIITISPEYTNAVLHGPSGGATGVGTMTSDICSDALNINDADDLSGDEVCGTNETYNFYKWTSPQATNQTYAIYVTYQLPETFKQFASGQTSIMGRTDVGPSSGTASVSYKVYRNNSSTGLTQCGTSAVAVSSGAVSSWQTGTATGAQDPSTCGFTASDSIVFEIDVSAYQNANAYVGNLNFTFSNR